MHMRFYLGDSQKVKYSDDALLSALNLAMAIAFETFVGYASTVGRKRATITTTDGVGILPADFHSVVLIEDGTGIPLLPDYGKQTPGDGYYRIVGGNIYSSSPSMELEYHYIPLPISSVSNDIDCPGSLLTQLILVAVNIAKGDRMAADNAIYSMVRALASRAIPYIPDQKAFR